MGSIVVNFWAIDRKFAMLLAAAVVKMRIGCARGSSDFPAAMKQWFSAPDHLANGPGFVQNQPWTTVILGGSIIIMVIGIGSFNV
ncbi:hypothetical protein BDW74DRAFT_143716, partial [Aspergillus multicolor]|uniref:uncharacterized protein n=1 Tax=Aspergillus multicolor TaxID=41759 RepID=UPI003CCCE98E